jgi:transposase
VGEIALPAERPSYTRLTRADHRIIMKLHDDGLTLSAIAQQLNRSVSTIHEVVDIYLPSDDLAKRKLRASALSMAENIVKNGLPRDHVATLKGLNVLDEPTGSGIVIQIGIKDSEVQMHLSPPNAQ